MNDLKALTLSKPEISLSIGPNEAVGIAMLLRSAPIIDEPLRCMETTASRLEINLDEIGAIAIGARACQCCPNLVSTDTFPS